MKIISLVLSIFLFSSIIHAQWVQKGADINGEAAEDYSGFRNGLSMSADGNTLAVGAYKNDGLGIDAGHVRVYQWNGTSWINKGADIDGEAAGDNSGYSVALTPDGNTLAIGAIGNDDAGSNAGHVRIFQWSSSTWTQIGTDIDGESAGDASGWSIDISDNGNIVAIGAPQNDGTGPNAGHARIYEWSGSAWAQKGADIDGEATSDFSGAALSLSTDGNIVAIGAANNDGTDSNAGHVRVYQWNGSGWALKGNDLDGETAGDGSGSSLNISGDGTTLAIGALNNDETGDNAGHTRIYQWNGSNWIQKGVDIDGEAEGDNSGYRVELSTDGNTLLVSALKNDGTGLDAGHAQIFEWNGTTWVQNGDDIDAEAAGDAFGWSVAMNANGNSVAIGAPYNGGNGTKSGHIRVFTINAIGVNELDASSILIYPNPSVGNLSIDLGLNFESVVIRITDLKGKIIKTNAHNECQFLNLKLDAPAGVYVLTIDSEEKSAVFRLIIE